MLTEQFQYLSEMLCQITPGAFAVSRLYYCVNRLASLLWKVQDLIQEGE